MRRKLLIIVASAGAFLIAALLFVRAYVTRDDTTPVDVTQVVEDYRGETSAASTVELPAGVTIPEPGVYEYRTSGQEEVDLLGGSTHEYPATTPLAISPTDCGFEQTWTALDKRVETWTFCKEPRALVPERFADVHSFFGRTDDRSYDCTGGSIPLSADARPRTITCTREGTTRTDEVKALGAEEIDVDGTKVDTVHVRLRTTLEGTTDGTGTTDWWLRPDTGLPIRVVVRNTNESDTPIGTRAPYDERYELKLAALDPVTG